MSRNSPSESDVPDQKVSHFRLRMHLMCTHGCDVTKFRFFSECKLLPSTVEALRSSWNVEQPTSLNCTRSIALSESENLRVMTLCKHIVCLQANGLVGNIKLKEQRASPTCWVYSFFTHSVGNGVICCKCVVCLFMIVSKVH